MTESNARPDPGRYCGLFSSIVSDGRIRVGPWRSAAASGGFVGTCRSCGGFMVPDALPDEQETRIEWYVARCLTCEQECAAPDGRVSSRTARGS